MTIRRPFLAALTGLAMLATLAGCASQNTVQPLEVQIIQAGRQAIQSRRAAAGAEAPPLTRAFLDTVEPSYIEATLERRDQTAFMLIDSRRRDDHPGEIVTWKTGDNVTLSFRNGVLIATRGLGGNVISAQVQVADDTLGPSGPGAHVLQLRALDNKVLRLPMVCDLVDLGPETIVIVQRAHETRHLQQRCEQEIAGLADHKGGTVTNDYWIDSNAGLIWQSRQWAGPELGYLQLRRLTK